MNYSVYKFLFFVDFSLLLAPFFSLLAVEFRSDIIKYFVVCLFVIRVKVILLYLWSYQYRQALVAYFEMCLHRMICHFRSFNIFRLKFHLEFEWNRRSVFLRLKLRVDNSFATCIFSALACLFFHTFLFKLFLFVFATTFLAKFF